MRSFKWALLPCLIAVLAALAIAGCGSSSSNGSAGTGTASAAGGACATAHGHHKIKVGLKVAAVYASFKHWVYSPLRAGAFKSGAPGKTKALVKAGVALVADAALLKSVRGDVADDKTLCHVLTPFERLESFMGTAGSKLKSGHGTEQDLNQASGLVEAVKSKV